MYRTRDPEWDSYRRELEACGHPALEHLGMIFSVVRRCERKSYDPMDAVQAALLGLLTAWERDNGAGGLSVYLYRHIHGAVVKDRDRVEPLNVAELCEMRRLHPPIDAGWHYEPGREPPRFPFMKMRPAKTALIRQAYAQVGGSGRAAGTLLGVCAQTVYKHIERFGAAVERPVPILRWEDAQRNLLIQALDRTDGNRRQAGKLLGLGEQSIYNLIERRL